MAKRSFEPSLLIAPLAVVVGALLLFLSLSIQVDQFRTFIEHFGSAMIVAGVVAASIEYWKSLRELRIQAEYLNEVKLALGRAVAGLRQNPDLLGRAIDWVFSRPFFRENLKIRYEFSSLNQEVIFGGERMLKVLTVLSYRLVNKSDSDQTFKPTLRLLPVGATVPLEFRSCQLYSVKVDGQQACHQTDVALTPIGEAGHLTAPLDAAQIPKGHFAEVEMRIASLVRIWDQTIFVSLDAASGLELEVHFASDLDQLEITTLFFGGNETSAPWAVDRNGRTKKWVVDEPLLPEHGVHVSWNPKTTPLPVQDPLATITPQEWT